MEVLGNLVILSSLLCGTAGITENVETSNCRLQRDTATQLMQQLLSDTSLLVASFTR